MSTVDFKVLRPSIAKICGNDQRLIKAFENLFKVNSTDTNISIEAIEAAQITADMATAQALLAITLIEAVNQLAELVSTQPIPTCTCSEYEDLIPRTEQIQQDVFIPSYQAIEPMNLNLEAT